MRSASLSNDSLDVLISRTPLQNAWSLAKHFATETVYSKWKMQIQVGHSPFGLFGS